MKKFLAKSAAILATASLVAVNILPAFADSATNDTTGFHSSNTTEVENKNKVTVTNVSDAYILNVVKTTANTGGNSASQNTLGGMVQTGDAATNVVLNNSANINTTLLSLSRSGSSNTAGNSVTGAESTNEAEIENKNKIDVLNDNTAVLKNIVCAESNTGGNAANQNTGLDPETGAPLGGQVQTGDAATAVYLNNRANDSFTKITGLADFGINNVGNAITGFHSSNEAEIENKNFVDVENVSDASVFNKVRASATTGANSASQNTLGGMIGTGDAQVALGHVNAAGEITYGLDTNANIVTTLIDGDLGGSQTISGNSVTGAESTNETELENKNFIEVSNRNNKGDSEDAGDYECDGVNSITDLKCRFHWGVVNIDEDNANTGGNWGNQNTYPGSIASGIAMVGKYIRVCLNDTLTSIGGVLQAS